MKDKGLKLGITSYSTRKFSLEEALAINNRLNADYISLKSFHLPLEASPDEIKAVATKVAEVSLTLMGCGVVYLPNDEETIRNAFEYAQTGGMPVITASPDIDALPICNELVQEYDIKIAIHNHGPGDEKYPLPTDAYDLVKDLDPRMGVCPDIGHTKRLGADPVEAIKQVFDRMHDFHIKDVNAAKPDGSTCEVGRGVIDIAAVLQTLLDLEYDGHVALEFEKDPEDPVPGMAESLGYIRGVLSQL
jgi:sugar phosphate isomerase/epimerase